MGDIAIIVTSSRLQVTLRVETCVELELSLPESDLEPSLLIIKSNTYLSGRILENEEFIAKVIPDSDKWRKGLLTTLLTYKLQMNHHDLNSAQQLDAMLHSLCTS